MGVNGHIAAEPSSVLPVCAEERRLYGGEQSCAFYRGNRHLQSCTAIRSFMPAHRLFTHASATTHCKVRETDTNTHMLPLIWSRHKEDTESWVVRDKGRGEQGLERGAAKTEETSILSVLAGHWATASRQESLSVPWHRLCICGNAPKGCSPTFFHKRNSIFSGFVGGGG